MDKLRILLTGGAGFIGSHIAEYLLANNICHLRIVDNLVTGKMTNIQHLLDKYTNVEFIFGDITNINLCREIIQDIDVVCHQAALGSVPRSLSDPLNSHNTNVNGFLNMLIVSAEHKIKRFVYASSSSVYGDNSDVLKREDVIGKQLSPYAITKYIDELYADLFTRIYGVNCIGLRYFNVFGPRQDPNGQYAAVIPKFINSILNGQSPIINGDGYYSRDFTYVDNVVYANILALTTQDNRCFGNVFNIACGGNITILELFDIIHKIINKYPDLEPIFGPERSGDIPHSLANISKSCSLLGYSINTTFKEGIYKTINYYLELKKT